MHEIQPSHLLVPNLRIQANHVVVLQRGDERQCVTNGREQDVATRFIWLRLQGKAKVVPAINRILRQGVEALTVTIKRRLHVLRAVVL